MTNIICEEDCGNAPKGIQIRDFNIAFAKGEPDLMLQHLTDTIVWNYVGDKVLEGIETVGDALRREAQQPKAEMTIFTIMTHGKVGGANGVVTLSNGKQYHFSHIYKFSSAAKNAKIKGITSYIIAT
jgi:hypothetical protein